MGNIMGYNMGYHGNIMGYNMGYSLVNHWDIIWDTMGHLYIYIQ